MLHDIVSCIEKCDQEYLLYDKVRVVHQGGGFWYFSHHLEYEWAWSETKLDEKLYEKDIVISLYL